MSVITIQRRDTSGTASPFAAELDDTRTPIVPDEQIEGAEGLKSIHSQIRQIQFGQQEDDIVIPTSKAFERIVDILQQTAYSAMVERFRTNDPLCEIFEGFVTIDDNGGYRIEWWVNRTYCVHLAVGSSGDPSDEYIFVRLEDSGKGELLRPVYPSRFASLLRRLHELQASNSE